MKKSSLLFLLSIFLLQACELKPEEKTTTTQTPKIETPKPELLPVLIATANRTCKVNEDCQVAPLGSKACGGPSDFIVYSTAQGNPSDILAAINTYTQQEKTYLSVNNAVGTCEALVAPQTQCVQSVCAYLDPNGEPLAAVKLIINFEDEAVAADALSKFQDDLPTSSSRRIFSKPPIYSFVLQAGIRANDYLPLIKRVTGVKSAEIDSTVNTQQK